MLLVFVGAPKVNCLDAGKNGPPAALIGLSFLPVTILEGRWLTPDPVILFVERRGRSDKTLDLEGFLRRPRRAEIAPSSKEVQKEIEDHLTPAPLYRATWKVQLGEDEDFRWEEGGVPDVS